MASSSARGANDFLALSKRLKAAGQKELRKELNKAMQNAAKPLIPKVREAAARDFPQAGGLARRMSKKPYRAQTRTGAKTAGVRIVGTKVDPRIDSQGRVQHPVFGHKPTVVQQVPEVKGYFSDTLANEGPQIRSEVLAVLSDFAARVARGGI